MAVECIHPENLSQSDEIAWRRIISSNRRYESPYFTPDFAKIAGRLRSTARILIARNEAGDAVGFLPIQKDGFGMALARPLGAPFADYNGPILEEGYEAVVPELIRYAGASLFSFTGFPILAELPKEHASKDTEDEDLLRVDLKKHDPVMLKTGAVVRGQVRAYVADMRAGWEDYAESCRAKFPKHFKKARRLWRQMEREVGEMQIQHHEASLDALETLIRWKRDQFDRTNLHDVLGTQWSQDLIKACFEHQSETFSGVLTTLRCDGKLVAAEFGIRSGDVLHGWISGYNGDYHSYSPGTLLQTRLLEEAAKHGVIRADLGIGADHYKKYYASDIVPVGLGVIPAKGAFGALRCIAGDVWHEVEGASFLGPVSKLAGRLRRRMDVILAVETDYSRRAEGIMRVFRKA